jgi:excisionase family DNA binding protein
MDEPKTKTLDRDWLTVEQAADYLQVSPFTIRRMVKDRKIVGSKLGEGSNSSLRISAQSIRDMLERNKS